jgi:hypothetical protein
MLEGGDPAFCPACGSLLERIFTPPRIIIPQSADPENDVLGIIARSSSEQDKRAIQEKYIEQNDPESSDLVDEKPAVSMDTILSSGIVEAARSGKGAVDAWRQDWVRPELEGIADI